MCWASWLNFGIMGVWVAMIGEWGVRGVFYESASTARSGTSIV